MKKAFLFPLLLSVLFSCSQSIKYSVEAPHTAQPAGNSISQRDGKCYKNCIVPDRYESVWVSFPIYLGAEPDAPLRLETVIVEPPKSQWVKSQTGEVSLVQSPAVTRDLTILADTLFYKDFRLERIETKKMVEKGGFLRETEVLCTTERTPNLFLQISAALKSYGYLEEPKNQWDMKFNQAIQQFQKANSLPVGDLNLETLEFLSAECGMRNAE